MLGLFTLPVEAVPDFELSALRDVSVTSFFKTFTVDAAGLVLEVAIELILHIAAL